MYYPTDVLCLCISIIAASFFPFWIAKHAYGWKRAAVALAIGILLGAVGGILLLSWQMFTEGHQFGHVIDEWRGNSHSMRYALWNWIAIFAILGMFLSFISVMFLGRFLGLKPQSKNDAAEPNVASRNSQ